MTTNLSNFVSSQNTTRQQNSVNLLFANDSGLSFGQAATPATSTADIAIGWQQGNTVLPTTVSGGGKPLYNALVLDGTHTAGAYQFNVDGNGNLTITDQSTTDTTAGQTMKIAGLSYVLFNDGVNNTAGYSTSDMFIIASGNNAEIARFYQTTFNRLPDLPGYEAWTQAVANGALDIHQAAQVFVTSGEFTSHYGDVTTLSDLQFVTDLYTNMLGRTPDASGLAAWVSYLGTVEATNGSTTAGNVAARGLILEKFATSAEEIGHSSSWLIDTSNGGYADASMGISASTAVGQMAATGIFNANLVAPVATDVYSSNYSAPQGGALTGTSIVTNTAPNGFAGTTMNTAASGVTITLSANTASGSGMVTSVALYGSHDTVMVTGGAETVAVFGNNTTINMPGNSTTSNLDYILMGAGAGINIYAPYSTPTNLVVTGFTAGADHFRAPLITAAERMSPGQNVVLLDATHAPVSGASLNFATTAYIVNLGNVGDGSAASVAAVADKEYVPAGLAGTLPTAWTGAQHVTPGENVTFIGETSSGNTVIYNFANWQASNVTVLSSNGQALGSVPFYGPTGNPDIHGTHTITADELTLSATLVGVQARDLTLPELK